MNEPDRLRWPTDRRPRDADRLRSRDRRRHSDEHQLPRHGCLPYREEYRLRSWTARRSGELGRNLTEKLLAYALCRQLEGYDEIVVDRLMETIAQDGYRMQTLITEIVTNYPFTHRRIQPQVTALTP